MAAVEHLSQGAVGTFVSARSYIAAAALWEDRVGGVRVVEGARLKNGAHPQGCRGFEPRPLRQAAPVTKAGAALNRTGLGHIG